MGPIQTTWRTSATVSAASMTMRHRPAGIGKRGPRGPPPGGGSPPGGGGGGEMDNFTKAVIAGAFIMGMGTGVWFNSEASVHKSNVASTEIIDRQTPNSEVCMANGYSSMVFDQRIFVSFNPCALRLVPAPCDLLHTRLRGSAEPGHRSVLTSSPSLLVIDLCALSHFPVPCLGWMCHGAQRAPQEAHVQIGLKQSHGLQCPAVLDHLAARAFPVSFLRRPELGCQKSSLMEVWAAARRFNVYVAQPEVKPGCVIRRSNISLLEKKKLVSDKEVRSRGHYPTLSYPSVLPGAEPGLLRRFASSVACAVSVLLWLSVLL